MCVCVILYLLFLLLITIQLHSLGINFYFIGVKGENTVFSINMWHEQMKQNPKSIYSNSVQFSCVTDLQIYFPFIQIKLILCSTFSMAYCLPIAAFRSHICLMPLIQADDQPKQLKLKHRRSDVSIIRFMRIQVRAFSE